MFAGSCGVGRLEDMDSESDTGRVQCSGGNTLSLLSPLPDSPSPSPVFVHPNLLTLLPFPFSIPVPASQAFNFNPAFLTKKS